MAEDLREQVARAICYESHCAGKCRQEGVPCKALTEHLLHETCTIAHQADAAIAEVVERCAQACDYESRRTLKANRYNESSYLQGRSDAAFSLLGEIRALAKKE